MTTDFKDLPDLPASETRARELDRLYQSVYNELRSLARHHLARERRDHTLQPTALVHETYLKLRRQNGNLPSEAQFLAIASGAMRQVLIDIGRRKKVAWRKKRELVDLDCIEQTGRIDPVDFLAIQEALDNLGRATPNGPRHVRLVEWVLMVGISIDDAARHLDISPRQAHRDWKWARTWLAAQLSPGS